MHWHASGQASLSGDLLRLAGEADAAFVQLAGVWGAEAERHPSTLPAAVLRKTGYLRSFPHQATFAVGLDPDALSGFAGDPDQDPGPSSGRPPRSSPRPRATTSTRRTRPRPSPSRCT